MKISNKITYPVAIAITAPLLLLGGCANNDTVKMAPDEALAFEQVIDVNEDTLDNVLAESGFVSIETEELIEVIEPVEALVENPIEESSTVKAVTPKPDESMIGFAFDQSDIDSQYGELLWQHAQYLKENKNLILNISGHTDNSGARLYNEMLSKKRADQVAKILIDFGVSKDRIKVIGNASDQPLIGAVTNKEHRRVELDYHDQQIVSN